MVQKCFAFHQREPRTDTITRTGTEWQIGERMDFTFPFRTESLRIETRRIRIILGITMNAQHGQHNAIALLQGDNVTTFVDQSKRFVTLPVNRTGWWPFPQCFCKY